MTNVLETVFMFFIVIAAGLVGLTVLSQTHSLAEGNCAYNSTGSLVNCSLSDNDYKLINTTATQYGTIFSTFTPLTYVLAVCVIIAIFMALAFLTRK